MPECNVSPAPRLVPPVRKQENETMNGTGNQAKGRVIGMDIHPTVFSACALENSDARTAQELYLHHQIDMDDLERWYKKNNRPGDLYVMESCNNSFETAERLKGVGAHVVVLESVRIGQIHKAYLKDDKVDARKVARVYLSGLAHDVWQPDEKTRERREILAVYDRVKRDSVRCRNRIWSWLTQHGVKKPETLKLTEESGLNWILQCRTWSERQKLLIRTMHSNLVYAQSKRKELKRLMASEIAEDLELLKLQQLCGLRLITIYALGAVIGDISRFKNPKKLVAYIGLQPSVNQSGANEHNGGLKHTGRKDLRALLVQAAHAILRMAPASNNLATWGRAMTYRKCRNVAAIAVARKLTVYIWYLLRGFFTPLSNLSTSFRTKLMKLAVEIGTPLRRDMGYKTIKDFIQKKEKLLLAET
jgi:transposase